MVLDEAGCLGSLDLIEALLRTCKRLKQSIRMQAGFGLLCFGFRLVGSLLRGLETGLEIGDDLRSFFIFAKPLDFTLFSLQSMSLEFSLKRSRCLRSLPWVHGILGVHFQYGEVYLGASVPA